MSVVWIDGELLSEERARVSPFDHALLTGDGVFETLRVYRGVPFAARRHLDRLARSAAGLRLSPPDPDLLREVMDAVLAANGLVDGRLRITVTGGVGPLGSDRAQVRPTVIVAVGPPTAWPTTTEVAIVPWPRNERGALAGLKTTSYAENVIALAEAQRRDASEAIFANLAGHLCEGTGSNVFYVVDGELRTPTLESGCLAGVTRRLILEWYGGREVDEPIEVIAEASEVFLAATTRDVQAVHRWDDRLLPAPGPITTAVADAWREREPELLGF
jgi:branched-chain amino acid aminotransferase